MNRSFLCWTGAVLLLLSHPGHASEGPRHVVGLAGEFLNTYTYSGPRIRLLGVVGFSQKTGLEMAVAYGSHLRTNLFGGAEKPFTVGFGIRRVLRPEKAIRFYHTLSGGVANLSSGAGFFFQPKIGVTPRLTSRIFLDISWAWTISILKENGFMEGPRSIGVNFLL